MKIRLISLLVALSLAAVPQAQCENESRCRSAQSSYWAYANDEGTVTGYLGDDVYIRNSAGAEVTSHRTIQGWCNYFYGNPNGFVRAVEFHSGGQVSIRFRYWCILALHPLLKGGSVSVYRSGCRIDVDALK
jgi:hypothetical protein